MLVPCICSFKSVSLSTNSTKTTAQPLDAFSASLSYALENITEGTDHFYTDSLQLH